MTAGERNLQIDEDSTFQRHQMRFERVGWAMIVVVLLGALLGIFGGGPLSRATAGDADAAIRVDYGRLERKSNPTSISVHLAPEAVRDGEARVWIGRDWAAGVVIESVAPEPDAVEVDQDRLVYVFAVRPGDGAVEIAFHLKHERWGWQRGEIGLDGGASHEFGQFVYP